MHLNPGEIKAYLDQALPEAGSRRAAEHLEACPPCRAQVEEMRARGGRVSTRLAWLDAGQEGPLTSPVVARARLQEKYLDKENLPMAQKIFAKPYRPAWVLAGVVLVLAIALLFPPVRAAANSFLGLFRIQQITLVPVDSGDLPDRLASSKQLERLMADQGQFEDLGEHQVVADAGQAGQLAGISVRLPASLGEPDRLEVQPGGRMSMTVDLPRIQAVLDEIGRSDIRLPAELNGAEVSVEIPMAVQASYGTCEYRAEEFNPDEPVPPVSDCTTLLQAASPVINAPPGLDLAQLGQAFLEMMGMPADRAAEFSQTVDWANTLVIPVPRNLGSFTEVTVDGVAGTLVWDRYQPGEPGYMLLWVKDGVVYALSGSGEKDDALEIANSLQ
jgi:hypothetical protein